MPVCHGRGAELQQKCPCGCGSRSRACSAGEGARMSVQALRRGLWLSTWARHRLPGARMRAARLRTSAPAVCRARRLWRRLRQWRRKWTSSCPRAQWWPWWCPSPMQRRRRTLLEARLRASSWATCRARPLWRRLQQRRRKWTLLCPRVQWWRWWCPSPMRRRCQTRSLESRRTTPKSRRPGMPRGCGLCVRAKQPLPMCTRPSCVPGPVPVVHSLGALAAAGPGSSVGCLAHVCSRCAE